MWCPHEESNLDLRFRKPVFYPLNYKGEYFIGASGGIRTPNNCFEGRYDIHFTTDAFFKYTTKFHLML